MTPLRFAAAAAAAVAAGLGVAGCGTQHGATAGRQAPQRLHLSTTATPSPGSTAVAPPIMVSPAPPGLPGWAQVRLTGRLPAIGPSTGAVRSLSGGEAAQATARTLAAALGVPGPVQRVAAGWRAAGPGILQVADGPGQRWTYVDVPIAIRCYRPVAGAAGGPARAVSGAASATAAPAAPAPACPMKPGQPQPFEPGTPPTAPPAAAGAPSGAAAEAVAMPVLRAAGVAGAPRRITVIGSYTFVSAEPIVDGLPTAGLSTTIGVGPGGRIIQASGWLSRPISGASYPLISAQQAFNRLRASSHPAAGGHPPEVMCPLNPDTLCATPGQVRLVQVTGASYGLALSYTRGEPVLVPSWLFSVAGSNLRIPEVAINPRYLGG